MTIETALDSPTPKHLRSRKFAVGCTTSLLLAAVLGVGFYHSVQLSLRADGVLEDFRYLAELPDEEESYRSLVESWDEVAGTSWLRDSNVVIARLQVGKALMTRFKNRLSPDLKADILAMTEPSKCRSDSNCVQIQNELKKVIAK